MAEVPEQPSAECPLWKRCLDPAFWRQVANPHQAGSLPARAFRVGRLLLKGYLDDNLTIHASSLTFVTLTSLVPILAVAFALFKGFGVGDELMSQRFFDMDWLSDMPQAFQEAVQNLMALVQHTNFSALGGVGLVFFVITAALLLANIEKSFNLVWGVETSRNIARQIINYTSVLVLVPLLLFAAGGARAGIVIHQHFGGVDPNVWLQSMLSFLTLWLAFGFLFAFVPNTRVHIRPAVVGSLTTTVVFLGWMKMFMIMQVGVARNNAIYGAFAAIPVFMFWLYVTWVILLLGAELTFALQNSETYSLEGGAASSRLRILIALFIMRKAGQAALRRDGGMFNAADFAREQRTSIRLVNSILDLLVRRNYLVRVADVDGAYSLRPAPEKVVLRTLVMDLVSDSGTESDAADDLPVDAPMRDVLDRIHKGLDAGLGELTLADMVRERQGAGC